MSEDRTVRWTVDCWVHGCGWSLVGWDTGEMQLRAAEHVREKHP